MHDNQLSLPASEPGMTPVVHRLQRCHYGLRRALIGAALCSAMPNAASAYTATLTPATPLTVYLQVGVGGFTNDYINGGQPGNNTTINRVSATVAAAAVGNGTAQAMTTDSTAIQSYWDGYTFCSVPGQLYIGGFYRTAGGATAAALVTATVPAALTDAAGDTIPFSKIRWTSSGNGDSGAQPFAAGNFVNGSVQNVGSMSSNTWNESCWTFSYLNNTVPPAGTFTGVVRYTLSAP
ncbi:MAG TPA: hypothetical protein VGO37_21635 [Steroidobacteraceae bacterium]|jgi:hypothetical protein|nr:hypothetical protein [Steroidobacteraceae bacterium]